MKAIIQIAVLAAGVLCLIFGARFYTRSNDANVEEFSRCIRWGWSLTAVGTFLSVGSVIPRLSDLLEKYLF